MAKKIARLIISIFGAALGVGLIAAVDSALQSFGLLPMRVVLLTWALIAIYVAGGLLFAILLYIFSPHAIDAFLQLISGIETKLSALTLSEIFFGVLGLIIGLVLAFLISSMMSDLISPWFRFLIGVLLYISLGYLGWNIVIKRRSEIEEVNFLKKNKDRLQSGIRPKLLDTSVIIDGRIADICATGLWEGDIVVPAFVLRELQHIADSADALKRVRGRRGLDILSRMQKELEIPVQVVNTDYEDLAEVDAKLLRMAKEMDGVVVTNDYNLNKVAAVQHVPVFNINDLANAVKPALVSGEELTVCIVKEGKEAGQGVAYLDDGTMIVVDGGRKLVGETVPIAVTSVLQTSAGRMIFAKAKA